MSQADQKPAVGYAEIMRLAWPASVAASVTPLLGAVDVWALAQSTRPLDIAAVGLGSVIFSLAYWTFGFIRMSVAGLSRPKQQQRNEDFQEELPFCAAPAGTMFERCVLRAQAQTQSPPSLQPF